MPDRFPQLLDRVGLWREPLRPAPAGPALPALFLDRDGVVVEESDDLSDPDKVTLVGGAADVIARCNRAGVPVVVVTNQSGIARGLYGWAEFAAVQARLLALLEAHGGALDMVLACAYHREGTGALRVPDHDWRKPRPGMLRAAAQAWPIALERSWIVGDRAIDLEAARAAGLSVGIHVATGHGSDAGEREAAQLLAGQGFEVRLAPSIAAVGGLPPVPERAHGRCR